MRIVAFFGKITERFIGDLKFNTFSQEAVFHHLRSQIDYFFDGRFRENIENDNFIDAV